MTIHARSTVTFLFCLILPAIEASRLYCQTQPTPPPAQSDQKPAPLPNPDADGIYHFGDGVKAPKAIHTVEPEFPQQARKRQIGGNCTVRFVVETDGQVRDVHIVKSASAGLTNDKDREAALEFDQRAVGAVSQYRFEPGLFQGKPVPVRMQVIIRFQLF